MSRFHRPNYVSGKAGTKLTLMKYLACKKGLDSSINSRHSVSAAPSCITLDTYHAGTNVFSRLTGCVARDGQQKCTARAKRVHPASACERYLHGQLYDGNVGTWGEGDETHLALQHAYSHSQDCAYMVCSVGRIALDDQAADGVVNKIAK